MFPSYSLLASMALPLLIMAEPVRIPLSARDMDRRGVPAGVANVTRIMSPGNATLWYKEPGKYGVCETTPGVDSYSGYISLNETTNFFFWYFEARNDPAHAPITLWLNGGPGGDSINGLFGGTGPCEFDPDGMNTTVNPYSYSEYSNMLYLSQPLGVGFSYEYTAEGSLDFHGELHNATGDPVTGRFGFANPSRYDTSYSSAVAAWEVMQVLLYDYATLDPEPKNTTFNLWTVSYGGQYGPIFFDYFREQNDLIRNGIKNGTAMTMGVLGIGNGLIDVRIQYPYYPRFAVENSYGIEMINNDTYRLMQAFLNASGNLGCLAQIKRCAEADRSTPYGIHICGEAQYVCINTVYMPPILESSRSAYDIRRLVLDFDHYAPGRDPLVDYLNIPEIQQAIGVNINYTEGVSETVYMAFDMKGDEMYPEAKQELESLLDHGVRVVLFHGDADYVCNWLGGEEVSLALEYDGSKDFYDAGYANFTVDGKIYGEVRQHGDLAFLRIYDSGHAVELSQPKAAQELFRRALAGLVLDDGSQALTSNYSTKGSKYTKGYPRNNSSGEE